MNSSKQGLLGSLLLVGESLLQKSIGLVSTLILARVLVPEDFGLVAIAMIVLGLLEVLAQTGSKHYLLRCDEINRAIVNTAWTIDAIINTVIVVLMIIVAPYVADYYGDTRLVPILYVLSLIAVAKALENPGLVYLRRAHNYAPIVKMTLITKVIVVSVTISIALIFQNYWALVIGSVASQMLLTLGSYIIHKFRPRFELANASEQWDFSGWLIPQAVLGYGRTQLDTFLVSSMFGKAELGSYHVLKYLGFIPCSHVLLPATQPLLVELAKNKSDMTIFIKQYNISFFATFLIAVLIAVLMVFQSKLITLVFLGGQWLPYEKLLAGFALLIPSYVIMHHASRTLMIFNKTKGILYYEFLSFVFIYFILIFGAFSELELFTFVRVGLENIVSLLFLLYVSIKYTGFGNTIRLLGVSLPFLLLALVAGYLSTSVTIETIPVFFQLFVAGLIYLFCIVLLFLCVHYLGMRQCYEWRYLEDLFQSFSAKYLISRGV